MTKIKSLTELEIAGKLRGGKAFEVHSKNDRQKVLNVARILELQITTKDVSDFKTRFAVLFVK